MQLNLLLQKKLLHNALIGKQLSCYKFTALWLVFGLGSPRLFSAGFAWIYSCECSHLEPDDLSWPYHTMECRLSALAGTCVSTWLAWTVPHAAQSQKQEEVVPQTKVLLKLLLALHLLMSHWPKQITAPSPVSKVGESNQMRNALGAVV